MTASPALLGSLATVGLEWSGLLHDADAVVLFGSRAAGCERGDSDWDLLCVGSGQSRLTQRLDILWITPEQATAPSSKWVGTELANHIARFGHVLIGEVPWTESYSRQELALARKRRQLEGHVRGLSRVWLRLNAVYRQRQLTELRRDLQRHAVLNTSEAVPPNATLDRMWCREAASNDRLLELLDHAGVGAGSMAPLLANFAICSESSEEHDCQ